MVLLDLDGDGAKEVLVDGGTSGYARLERSFTHVYVWQESSYERVLHCSNPHPHGYFRMLDANAALVAGDLDRALDLAMSIVTQSEVEWGMEVDGWERIVSYATVEAMLVHALRHEPEAMLGLLHEMETKYDQTNNPYVAAGQRLWLAYQDTQDPVVACEEMAQVVQERWTRAGFSILDHGGEALSAERICPLNQEAEVIERINACYDLFASLAVDATPTPSPATGYHLRPAVNGTALGSADLTAVSLSSAVEDFYHE